MLRKECQPLPLTFSFQSHNYFNAYILLIFLLLSSDLVLGGNVTNCDSVISAKFTQFKIFFVKHTNTHQHKRKKKKIKTKHWISISVFAGFYVAFVNSLGEAYLRHTDTLCSSVPTCTLGLSVADLFKCSLTICLHWQCTQKD